MVSAQYAYRMLMLGYRWGIRSFDFSYCPHMLLAIKRFRSCGKKISCFANPNWRCGVILDDKDLIDLRSRVIKTLLFRLLGSKDLEEIEHLPSEVREFWFAHDRRADCLSDHEVTRITLNIVEYESRIKKVADIAEYCLVGTDIGDWLICLKRLDIIETMCTIIEHHGMIPFAITHWPSRTLPVLETLPFAGYWCMLNPDALLFSPDGVCRALERATRPVFAFSVLRGHETSEKEIEQVINTVLKLPNVDSLVIGLKTRQEMVQTMPIVHHAVKRRWA